eukprot:TRINITY_DN19306_c0_g2_i1.p1 TRINITY_DN19306_c0_g2~~TRINITY_DN19306_c0_g2_i1.p1  ORF type:complete len:636 (+),score=112.70 TRINITY_DN19306_c0_g2_i1:128-2035(+)
MKKSVVTPPKTEPKPAGPPPVTLAEFQGELDKFEKKLHEHDEHLQEQLIVRLFQEMHLIKKKKKMGLLGGRTELDTSSVHESFPPAIPEDTVLRGTPDDDRLAFGRVKSKRDSRREMTRTLSQQPRDAISDPASERGVRHGQLTLASRLMLAPSFIPKERGRRGSIPEAKQQPRRGSMPLTQQSSKRMEQMSSAPINHTGSGQRRNAIESQAPARSLMNVAAVEVTNEAPRATTAHKKPSPADLLSEDYQPLLPALDSQLTYRERLQHLVSSTSFELTVGVVVIINAIAVGCQTEYWARNGHMNSPILSAVDTAMCVFFTIEWSLRVWAFECSYFMNREAWIWNWMDTLLVVTQLLEFTQLLSGDIFEFMHVDTWRMLRTVRLVRVTRLLRSFHIFDELRVIVSSILRSLSSLGWSVVLLMAVIYIFSIILLQIILTVNPSDDHEKFNYWFPGVFRTFLTLFECVVGGVSWDDVIEPLVEDIHPLMGVAFCIYVSISLFAMMNLLTGVFVDQAMRVVREDKDNVLAKRIADLFIEEDGEDEEKELQWEDFEEKLDCSAMQDYFAQINVETSQGRSLFDLLDADGSGSINCKEIVEGCLRLRGPARALDLMLVSRQVRDCLEVVQQLQEDLLDRDG